MFKDVKLMCNLKAIYLTGPKLVTTHRWYVKNIYKAQKGRKKMTIAYSMLNNNNR